MKLKIREITRAGIAFEDQAMPARIDLVEDFIDGEKPIVVKGHLQQVDAFIIAKLDVSYTQDTICARCLDNVNRRVSVALEFDIQYDPGDEFVDIGEKVREELLIAQPARVLCKEDCQGICPDCGVYLNEESCDCRKRIKE